MSNLTEFCYSCQKHRKPEDMTGKSGRRSKCRYCVERSKARSGPLGVYTATQTLEAARRRGEI